ncbi:UbiA family prenyltransferase [Euzebya rosea]|uniref:UbiA family prenyltransferase n=1 Tax=Euzebya rosea TaxID=2052804 RepID=UPI000D3E0E97|nr:UbiA family prenyltransferase [Euzebya rosea]
MLGAAHLEPSLVVVAVTAGLAVGVGMDGGQLALLMGAVLSGQLSVGWSNDWIDARRGRDDGRPDKPAATGAVARTTVQRAAVGALAVTIATSSVLGVVPGSLHLLAVALAWAYNAALKDTVWSPVSYLVAFGLLPVVVTTAAGAGWPAWWAVVAAACFGAGVHAANVLPDLERDRAQGIGGLPQRLGASGAVAMAVGFLGTGTATALLGPGHGTPLVAAATTLVLLIAVVAAHRAGRARLAFRLSMATGLLLVATLVARGSQLTG